MNTPENSDPEAKKETLSPAELRELLLEIKEPLEQDDRSFPPTPKPATYYDAPAEELRSTSGSD